MINLTLYTSPTCMPCHILANRLAAMAKENPDKLTYDDVDVTKSNPLNISGTPYIVIKKDDKEIFSGHVGNLAETIKQIKDLMA